jgi:hypothetical protein
MTLLMHSRQPRFAFKETIASIIPYLTLSVLTATKILNFRPYKISLVHHLQLQFQLRDLTSVTGVSEIFITEDSRKR